MRSQRKLIAAVGGLFMLAIPLLPAVGMDSAAVPSATQNADGNTDKIRAQARKYIAAHSSIVLTAEQETIKKEALSAFPAPCCKKFSMATCCCPCNLAKAVWGLSKILITQKGFDAAQVKDAALAWIHTANPGGFTGDACFVSKGCQRPFDANGCGGMGKEVL